MKQNLRLLVFGGRDFPDRDFEFAVLDYLHSTRRVIEVIEGGCRRYDKARRLVGADWFAKEWAGLRGVTCTTVDAEWGKYRGAAGPMRNTRMAEMGPDAAVGFPGGSGSADMREKVIRFRIPLWEPRPAVAYGGVVSGEVKVVWDEP